MYSLRLIVLLLTLLVASVNAGGGFQRSCRDHRLILDYPNKLYLLAAICTTYDQRDHYTEMDLNHCLLNWDGSLRYMRGGGGLVSCRDCYLANQEGQLNCVCDSNNGVLRRTGARLSEFVTNVGGNLEC